MGIKRISWYKRLKWWLKYGTKETLNIGDRDKRWIESMRADVKRWDLPVMLIIRNPVMVKGKVPVYFRREGAVSTESEAPRDGE